MSRSFVAGIGAACAGAALVTAVPANALTMKECSAKFQAAKSAGTLKEKNWQEFRKAQCGAGAGGGVAGAMPGPAFPTAVSPKYSQESAGKARMHTCLDQYRVNKAINRNGGLRWIQKGGGYYSACTKQLKG